MMSLTNHEEIGRVGRVGRERYEENGRVEFKLHALRCGTVVLQLTADHSRQQLDGDNSFNISVANETVPKHTYFNQSIN